MPHRIIIDQINTLLGNNRPNEALTVVYQAILDHPHSLEINTNALYLTLNMPPALCAQHLAQVSACHHVVGLETLTDKLITLFSSHPERYELFATLGNILCRLESADLAIKSFDQVLIAAGSADIAAKAIVGEYQATAASYDGVDAHQASGQNFVTLLAECLQGPRHRLNIVDAACGSGLAGPALRPWAASLTGLDLSPTMLAMADQTGLYDRLVEGDMTDTLNAMPESADLLICAGATCYLRDLAPFLAAARTWLKPGGQLFFADFPALDGMGVKETIGGTFRYCRSAALTREMAAAHGFSELNGILELSFTLPAFHWHFRKE